MAGPVFKTGGGHGDMSLGGSIPLSYRLFCLSITPLMVETELLALEARGTFTLKLWDENEGQLVTLGGVTFP